MVIFRKNTQILNFFRFPPVRSFPQFSQCSMPGSLHVQCTFNVCSLSVHSERMVPVEPVVKNFAVCEGRRGKRNRFYFGFPPLQLCLCNLCRENTLLRVPSRKSISFCFWPAGHIHIQHTHPLHASMLHAPAQRDAYEGDRSGQSGLSRYVACQVYGTWFHRCMVSCNTKLVSVSGRLPLKLTLNIQ